MEIEIINTKTYLSVTTEIAVIARVYFGEHDAYKTEAEALEAAELLKAFLRRSNGAKNQYLFLGMKGQLPPYGMSVLILPAAKVTKPQCLKCSRRKV